jgi:hypothetical protein
MAYDGTNIFNRTFPEEKVLKSRKLLGMPRIAVLAAR